MWSKIIAKFINPQIWKIDDEENSGYDEAINHAFESESTKFVAHFSQFDS